MGESKGVLQHFTLKDPEEPSQTAANNRDCGIQAACEWKIVPGTQEDGTFSSNHLNDWLSAIRASATESGHLTIAM